MKQGLLWIDLGLTFGWAALSEEDRVTFGEENLGSFRGLQLGGRFPAFRSKLRPIFARWAGRGVLGYETPQTFRSRDATASMFGMEASLLELVAEHGWTAVHTLAPTSLKKQSTGNGKTEKVDMIAAAAARWGLVASDLGHNETDALCGLAWMMRKHGRKESAPAKRMPHGPQVSWSSWAAANSAGHRFDFENDGGLREGEER